MQRYHTTDRGETKPCRVTTGRCSYESDSVHLNFEDRAEAQAFGEHVLAALYEDQERPSSSVSSTEIARAKLTALDRLRIETEDKSRKSSAAAFEASAAYRADQSEVNRAKVQRANADRESLTERVETLRADLKELLYSYHRSSVPSVAAEDIFSTAPPELQVGEMLVYRIEQSDGRGPYNIPGFLREMGFVEENSNHGALAPASDGIENPRHEDFFGFDGSDQLDAYLSQDSLRVLREFSTKHPIQISEYVVSSEDAIRGGTQTTFSIFGARGTRAMPIEAHRGQPTSVRNKLQESLIERWRESSKS